MLEGSMCHGGSELQGGQPCFIAPCGHDSGGDLLHSATRPPMVATFSVGIWPLPKPSVGSHVIWPAERSWISTNQ